MILVISREEKADAQESLSRMENVLTRAGVERDAIVLGVSDAREDRLAMGTSLCEAVYAMRTAKLCGKHAVRADEMGLYAYLFPMSENPFVCDRCRRVLTEIREYGNRRSSEGTLSAPEHGALSPEQDSAHHVDGK